MSQEGLDVSAAEPSRPAGGLPLVSAGFAALVAVILAVTGAAFRVEGGGPGQLTEPRKSFDDFPQLFLGYEWGPNTLLDEDTERVLGADYYLNRDGFRQSDASKVSLWVSYFGQSETLIEHEPQQCMRTGGWSLPFGICSTKIPMPPGADGKPWRLPVNVYLFQKDIERVLMVNTYCVSGHYLSNRDEARFYGEKGKGFYAQIRVTIPLTHFEWAALSAEKYDLPNDVAQVEAEVAKLEETRAEPQSGEAEKIHPYLRAVEILRYVVPALTEYFPAEGQQPGPKADH